MTKLNNIFTHTDCISEEMLTQYISGKLSPAEKHRVEKHLIDCEMCSDAAEGLQLISDKKRIFSIPAELNQKIHDRVVSGEVSRLRENPSVGGKVIFLRQYRIQLAVAASIVLILGLVLFFRNNMMMKEPDSASAEKMFADKFEPYPSEAKELSVPVTSSEESGDANNAPAESKKQTSAGKEGAKSALHLESVQKGKDISDRETFLGTEDVLVSEEERTEAEAPAEKKSPDDYRSKNAENEFAGFKKEEDKKSAAPSMVGSVTTAGAVSPIADKSSGKMEEKKNRENNALRTETETRIRSGESDEPVKKSKSFKKEKQATPQKVSGGYYETTVMTNTAANAPLHLAADQDAVIPDSTTVESPAIEEAMQKYNKQDYVGAVNNFERILKQNPNDEKALFYSAVSYMSLGQTEKAVADLNKVMQNKNSEYYDAAQWYVSLAYIKNNDLKNARENLLRIKNNPKSKYQKQADETLKEMDK